MISGVINVYKEPGYTSHDVVAKLRGILKQKKIGHMGTLDPYAVGVLPVCLGKGTKLCDILSEKDKTYKAVLLLYNLARRGEEVERPARQCKIVDITITDVDLPRVEMIVTCSKGTYIRTLCHDIGNKLGVYGCMDKLERTRVERFKVEESITLEQIEKARDDGRLKDYIVPVDQMLDKYSKCIVSEKFDKLIYNGNKFTAGNTLLRMNFEDKQKVRVYAQNGDFIGIYEFDAHKQIYKPIKIFL